MEQEQTNQTPNQVQRPKPEKKHFGLKKSVVVIGIVIVLNLFISLGIRTFGNYPDYQDYCPEEVSRKIYTDQQSCEEAGGMWRKSDREIVPKEAESGGIWCEVDYLCRQEYQTASDIYGRNFFIIEVIVGIILIVVGSFAIKAQSVSLGLSFGGLLALIVGTMRHWSGMGEYLQFIILGVALAVLIWLGVKKFKD